MPPHCDSHSMDPSPPRRGLRWSRTTSTSCSPTSRSALRRRFARPSMRSGPFGLGHEARTVAERLFLETVVRLHREGEGAPFTRLRPAGLDVGPVIPLAETAIGWATLHLWPPSSQESCRMSLHRRFALVTEPRRSTDAVGRGRPRVRQRHARLRECDSHHVLQAMHTDAHEHASGGSGGHSH